MAEKYVVNVDLADVWDGTGKKREFIRTLSWGDVVWVEKTADDHIELVKTVVLRPQKDGPPISVEVPGYIVPRGMAPEKVIRPAADNEVLRVNFVDVQQGDGAIIETPDEKLILVDGGDNKMFARYLAARFRRNTLAKAKDIDCIVVTHGDADHFEGLTEIFRSETDPKLSDKKRLFIRPQRIYHNGIVKGPSTENKKKVPDLKLLGKTIKEGDAHWLVELHEDLLAVPDARMNTPFRGWKAALAAYGERGPLEMKRLKNGDHAAFDFIDDPDIAVEVLGPLEHAVKGKPALKFLGAPPKGPRIDHESLQTTPLDSGSPSASHTINGHSIVLRLKYRNVSYLFTGDLNDEASRFLAQEHEAGRIDLRSEVFKVPHHGSADFSGGFIKLVAPLVSVVSSGDENEQKEHIHPRATIMGALGKLSRVDEPLIFVTELVAFFKYEGMVRSASTPARVKKRGDFYGFSRGSYGMVKTRTDGRRLLVMTDSGDAKMKEAYAYEVDEAGNAVPSKVVRA